MSTEKILKIACECKDFLNLAELTEFQGGLKQRSQSDVDKIVKSIKKYGFSFPFFVWKHEPCLYGWIDGDSHCWYNDRKQTTVIECKKPSKSAEHPTMKPIELFEYQIKNSSKAEDIVLDLFGGSGTTLIACEKNNRKARLMELDPHYCDVIRRRYTKWAKENNRPITSGCLE